MKSEPRRWLNRNVIGMSITSFLSDAGHEMVTAVLPGFLGVIGVTAAALGWIEGAADGGPASRDSCPRPASPSWCGKSAGRPPPGSASGARCGSFRRATPGSCAASAASGSATSPTRSSSWPRRRSSPLAGLTLLFVLAGLYVAAEDALEGAIPADLVPPGQRGTAYGLMGAVNGFGDLVASAMVGTLLVLRGATPGGPPRP